MQPLRRDVVLLTHQLGEHDEALAGRPHAHAVEQNRDLRLLAARHAATLASVDNENHSHRCSQESPSCSATAACGEDLGRIGRHDRVVAGFYPLAFAAEQIGGDRIDVTNLTPAGAEPHDLELTPREVEGILDADLVLYLGDGFQPAVEEAAAESNGEAIDVLDGLELRDD